MFEEFSRAIGPSEIRGLALHITWHVEADPSYDIDHDFSRNTAINLHRLGGEGLIAIRTLSGTGRVYLSPDRCVELTAGTLLFLNWDRLERYHCKGPAWTFWWFEFTLQGSPPFPLHNLLRVPVRGEEHAEYDHIVQDLRHADPTHRCLGSAGFSRMLYGWLAEAEDRPRTKPQEEIIHRVIHEMHRRLDMPWAVEEMADFAHMSTRGFRNAFRTVTGQSPKRFFDGLRLAMAHELLRLGRYTVADVAARLGYSSPFHLSKAFTQHFGLRPSDVRRGNS